MNISIAVVDSDKEYNKRLSEVLQQYDELTIYICSSVQQFQKTMENNHIDVVLFDPDISEERLTFPGIKLPICLYSDEARNRSLYADFAKVIKYQRVSNIYKEFIREYADKAGYSADFDYSQNTGILAVYSPIGGSGKTTVALAIASNYIPYLEVIFTRNVANFVQGGLYGIGLCYELISMYNINHKCTLRESKKILVKK